MRNLPQGKVEAARRAVHMVRAMDEQGFGACSNTEACEVICPQSISVDNIARMNWEYNWSRLRMLGASDSES